MTVWGVYLCWKRVQPTSETITYMNKVLPPLENNVEVTLSRNTILGPVAKQIEHLAAIHLCKNSTIIVVTFMCCPTSLHYMYLYIFIARTYALHVYITYTHFIILIIHLLSSLLNTELLYSENFWCDYYAWGRGAGVLNTISSGSANPQRLTMIYGYITLRDIMPNSRRRVYMR